ncbi:MAG: AbrB/MazE/SpoVT family DNA-binding domain-containing protein [Candidatus Binatia bacterium]
MGKAPAAMTDVLKVGRKGELTLPRRVCAALGIREGDELLLTTEEDSIVLKRRARRFAEYLDTLGRKP